VQIQAYQIINFSALEIQWANPETYSYNVDDFLEFQWKKVILISETFNPGILKERDGSTLLESYQ